MQFKLKSSKVQLSLERYLDISSVKLKCDVRCLMRMNSHSFFNKNYPPSHPPQKETRISILYRLRDIFMSLNLRLVYWFITNVGIENLSNWCEINTTSSRRIQDVAKPLLILKKSENNTERKQPCIQYFFGLCLCIYRASSCLIVQNCTHHATFLMRLLSTHSWRWKRIVQISKTFLFK